jgi:hypothetical protein
MAFPPSPTGFALHFVIFTPRAGMALVLGLRAVLYCYSNYFLRYYKNCTFITPMADISVTSVVDTYERRQNSKPNVCSTTFGRATLGATGVPRIPV